MARSDRRTVLEAAGAAGIALVSGCSGVLGGDGDDGGSEDRAPDFRRWFPTAAAMGSAGGPYLYAVFDVATLTALDGGGEGTRTETERETATAAAAGDPLVANPVDVYAVATLLTEDYPEMGLSPVLDGLSAESGAVDRWVLVDGHSVFEGSFDEDELRGAVESAGYDDPTDVGEFSLYGHPDEPYAVAVHDDAVVAVSADDGDPTAVAAAIARAGDGDDPRQHEADDTFDAVTRGTMGGDVVYGVVPGTETFEPDSWESSNYEFDLSPFVGAVGVSQSLTVNVDSGSGTARAHVVYGSEDDVDVDRLEGLLGTAAAEFDLRQNGAEVTLEATYGSDDVGAW
ncbi:hypothetical protein [Halostella litorea]|uniref:hypothetical protein n=1 Tax=Halostella litorea TaxID=2528831 RepID=UPI001092063A|nr:hypothetical protein [Halostella litorea]